MTPGVEDLIVKMLENLRDDMKNWVEHQEQCNDQFRDGLSKQQEALARQQVELANQRGELDVQRGRVDKLEMDVKSLKGSGEKPPAKATAPKRRLETWEIVIIGLLLGLLGILGVLEKAEPLIAKWFGG